MSDEIEEIRARHEAGPRGQIPLMGYAVAHADRATLLDEVDRQRAEIEQLRDEDTKTRHALKKWVYVCPDGGDEPTHERVSAVVAEVDRLRAENEKLRAENERLQAANKQLVAGIDTITRRKQEEIEKLRSEIERMRDVLRRVVVYPSGDRAARVAFVSVGCQVSFPLHPQTTWALELLVEFDQARRNALEGKP